MPRSSSARPSVSRPIVANPRIASPSIADPVPSGDSDATVYLSPTQAGPSEPEWNWRRGCFQPLGHRLGAVRGCRRGHDLHEIKTLFEHADRTTALPVYPWTTLLNGIGIMAESAFRSSC